MTSRARAAYDSADPADSARTPAGHATRSDLRARLRSGHGAGARRAVTEHGAARAEVVAALDDCVLRDPRAVPASESRSLYYARLYAELDASLDALAEHLLCDEDWTDESADRTALPLAVLGDLARADRPEAVALLRRYAEEGRDWTLALDHLARAADPEALSGMLALALERADDDELYDCVRRAAAMRPWREWGFADARLRAVVEKVDLDWWRWELSRGKEAAPRTPVTVDQVLSEAAASPRRSFVCGRRLASVATAEHRGLILATAWAGAEGARVAALRYLGEVADPALLDLAEATLTGGDTPVQVRQAAVQAVGALRSVEAVARARTWLAADGHTVREVFGRGGDDRAATGTAATASGGLADVAVRILAGAGARTDGPALIAALRRCRPTAHQDRFTLIDLVEGVGRLGLTGALEPVRDVYDASPCASLRSRAAGALARIEPGFTATTAVDCLWDCEAGTRLRAVDWADVAADGVVERLRVLARDPAEEDDVRQAARRRLAAA
ncbi:HEAT repeat domain-containing protein [Yinghuangia sp. ASG 101]|uniref:HEAT repeat domain-containing protein n=1 Tax=Yinghuangia sp. ASG 101 TaxID=2896848 RepID=UPI001E5946C6|nr:HEAT repeat domain-containing protein [Yinghuangia sp. ASG 101]UGQ10748.1 HEAT repeat domain-containing protein [Yinghuangia sp. ASG 101]